MPRRREMCSGQCFRYVDTTHCEFPMVAYDGPLPRLNDVLPTPWSWSVTSLLEESTLDAEVVLLVHYSTEQVPIDVTGYLGRRSLGRQAWNLEIHGTEVRPGDLVVEISGPDVSWRPAEHSGGWRVTSVTDSYAYGWHEREPGDSPRVSQSLFDARLRRIRVHRTGDLPGGEREYRYDRASRGWVWR